MQMSLCASYPSDAKIAKAEVNLMSLLSTFDDITDWQSEAEVKEGGRGSEEAPRLPRTNSLEDLDIKVTAFTHATYPSKDLEKI